MSPTKAIKILYCCSNAEKDQKLRDELEKHLKILQGEGVIETWHPGMIRAGHEVEGEFYKQLATADIIMPLISSDFIASYDNWNVVAKLAMERHVTGQARIVPVLLRPVDNNWKRAFSNITALPENERAVTDWKPYDKAFLSIAQGIRKVVAEMTDRSLPIKKSFKQLSVNLKPVTRKFANLTSTTISLVSSSFANYSKPRRRKISAPIPLILPSIALIAFLLFPKLTNLLGISSLETKSRVNVKSTQKEISTGWIQLGVIDKDSKLSVGTQLLQPSNTRLYPSLDPPVVPSLGNIVTVKNKVNLRKDKFLSSEPLDELQPGEKVIVQKVEIFTKSPQASPYIILRAQIRKCDALGNHLRWYRTCQQKQAVNKIPN
jgi:hypothetical protein